MSTAMLVAASDTGRVRDSNEDTVVCKEFPQADALLCIVADGVGGYAGGDIASQLAANSILQSVEEMVYRLDMQKPIEVDRLQSYLTSAIQEANQAIKFEQENTPLLSKMASTLVLLLKIADQLIVAHAGDSRCYLWSQDGLRQITRDHTLAQQMLDDDIIDQQQFHRSPYHHIINNGLGLSTEVKVEFHQLKFQPGQTFLLCSDGLTDCLSNANIEKLLMENRDLQLCANKLIEHANAAGGIDNISLALYAEQSHLPGEV